MKVTGLCDTPQVSCSFPFKEGRRLTLFDKGGGEFSVRKKEKNSARERMLSKDGKESEVNEMSKRNKSYSLLQAVKICSQQIHNNFGTDRTETRERERV